MGPEVLALLLRHALTALGGVLVARGYAEAADVEQAVGAIVILAGLFWSWRQKRQAVKVAEARVEAAAATIPPAADQLTAAAIGAVTAAQTASVVEALTGLREQTQAIQAALRGAGRGA